jgi:predicted  nucleic acid-binding Zn-ribbon protein
MSGMSVASAICAACGHVFSEREALGPCPACGGTERTLRREELVAERSDSVAPATVRRVEERRPDGSCDATEVPLDGPVTESDRSATPRPVRPRRARRPT